MIDNLLLDLAAYLALAFVSHNEVRTPHRIDRR
jgi:hypothetical protein